VALAHSAYEYDNRLQSQPDSLSSIEFEISDDAREVVGNIIKYKICVEMLLWLAIDRYTFGIRLVHKPSRSGLDLEIMRMDVTITNKVTLSNVNFSF
jgi:hypothetical protein